jgi:hypothetical protein
MVHENRKARNAGEGEVIHRKPIGILDQNAVTGEETRETLVAGRQGHCPLQRLAIAIDCQVAKSDVAAAVTTEDRSAFEVGSSAECGVIGATDCKIVRTIRKFDFG